MLSEHFSNFIVGTNEGNSFESNTQVIIEKDKARNTSQGPEAQHGRFKGLTLSFSGCFHAC